VQNRCINRPTHLELINVPFSGFTDDFVQRTRIRKQEKREGKGARGNLEWFQQKKVQILAYAHAPK